MYIELQRKVIEEAKQKAVGPSPILSLPLSLFVACLLYKY
jgi:hypothetical protein